jgi:hypothetical protein
MRATITPAASHRARFGRGAVVAVPAPVPSRVVATDSAGISVQVASSASVVGSWTGRSKSVIAWSPLGA